MHVVLTIASWEKVFALVVYNNGGGEIMYCLISMQPSILVVLFSGKWYNFGSKAYTQLGLGWNWHFYIQLPADPVTLQKAFWSNVFISEMETKALLSSLMPRATKIDPKSHFSQMQVDLKIFWMECSSVKGFCATSPMTVPSGCPWPLNVQAEILVDLHFYTFFFQNLFVGFHMIMIPFSGSLVHVSTCLRFFMLEKLSLRIFNIWKRRCIYGSCWVNGKCGRPTSASTIMWILSWDNKAFSWMHKRPVDFSGRRSHWTGVMAFDVNSTTQPPTCSLLYWNDLNFSLMEYEMTWASLFVPCC